MRKERFWYGVFMSAVMAVGVIGTSVGEGSLKVTAESQNGWIEVQSPTLVSRESWTNTIDTYPAGSITDELRDFTFNQKIYSDGTITIDCILNYSTTWGKEFSIGKLCYNDSLYLISYSNSTKVKFNESYNNEYTIVEFIAYSNISSGNVFTVTLTPLTQPTQTTITAFSKEIEIDGAPPATTSMGDINFDGFVNAVDAALILTYAADCGAGAYSGTIEDWYKQKC